MRINVNEKIGYCIENIKAVHYVSLHKNWILPYN